MTDTSLVTDAHRSRAAVYVRQSTLAQLERNTESTRRQYDLVARARALGWPRNAIRVVDADLGVSGSATGQRDGFEALVADVALGQVGIILALEVSRLARDNAAWYRLLDLAGVCDTLVADADAVYHPGLFDHRLVLGLKGMMAGLSFRCCGHGCAARCAARPRAGSCAAASGRAGMGRRGRRNPASPPTRR